MTAVKVKVEEKLLTVRFNENKEPIYVFTGAWDIRDFGRARSGLFRAYKHFIRERRQKEGVQA